MKAARLHPRPWATHSLMFLASTGAWLEPGTAAAEESGAPTQRTGSSLPASEDAPSGQAPLPSTGGVADSKPQGSDREPQTADPPLGQVDQGPKTEEPEAKEGPAQSDSAPAQAEASNVPAAETTDAPDASSARPATTPDEPEGMSIEEAEALYGKRAESKPALRPEVPPEDRKVVGVEDTGFGQRALGVRGALTLPGEGPWLGGGSLYERGIALLIGRVVSARYLEEMWIGQDAGGVTYSLAADAALGARWETSINRGPFARVWVQGEFKRFAGSRYSFLRAPGLQLGWGLDEGPWLIEVLGMGAPTLTGRLRDDEFSRRVKGPTAALAWSVAYGSYQMHGNVSQVFAYKGENSLWDGEVSVCGYGGKKPTRTSDGRISRSVGPRARDYSWAICADAAYLGASTAGGEPFSTVWRTATLGTSFLIGRFSRLDRTDNP